MRGDMGHSPHDKATNRRPTPVGVPIGTAQLRSVRGKLELTANYGTFKSEGYCVVRHEIGADSLLSARESRDRSAWSSPTSQPTIGAEELLLIMSHLIVKLSYDGMPVK